MSKADDQLAGLERRLVVNEADSLFTKAEASRCEESAKALTGCLPKEEGNDE